MSFRKLMLVAGMTLSVAAYAHGPYQNESGQGRGQVAITVLKDFQEGSLSRTALRGDCHTSRSRYIGNRFAANCVR